jgi:D-alanyl-D-alanine carboxypeptidase/D-alanyl-D-alanine carboxypeptidase (penicillin-binding protein 5/6)
LLILISIQPVAGLALTSEPSIEAPSALLIELRRRTGFVSEKSDEPLHIAAAIQADDRVDRHRKNR